MTYPINEDIFVEICLKELGRYDEADKVWAQALAASLNRAYYAGLEAGRKEITK